MPNGTYGGVGGRKTKVGQKTYFVFRSTRLYAQFGSAWLELEFKKRFSSFEYSCQVFP